jgi:ABC-2 type transport system ATP-binding protein
MSVALSIKNLSKRINGKDILKNINLNIEDGEICGFIGRNASGKSMLFKIITNLVLPSDGTVEYNGKKIDSNIDFINDIGALIEYPGFLPNYSGITNLKLLSSIKKKVSIKDIKETMILLGLNPDDKRPYRKYSLGMRQKLGIASAIMEKPKLIILDEPTNNLDIESVKTVHEILKSLNKEFNSTILLASHNPDDIKVLCTKIFEIENGELFYRKERTCENE